MGLCDVESCQLDQPFSSTSRVLLKPCSFFEGVFRSPTRDWWTLQTLLRILGLLCSARACCCRARLLFLSVSLSLSLFSLCPLSVLSLFSLNPKPSLSLSRAPAEYLSGLLSLFQLSLCLSVCRFACLSACLCVLLFVSLRGPTFHLEPLQP